ncbi:MAG: FAD-dependent oxidoreductase, partial [Planctomycetaceae bacterium]|nr:FAD-dependent oxidoreductase [Planctomycetaceae bacterium]
MKSYQYVIVGGGMTANAAVHGIREIDAKRSIALFSDERFPPYKRPPLSKGLWNGQSEESIWLGTESQAVILHLGQRIIHLDPMEQTVTDNQGESYKYQKLLLATGGRPRVLPFDHSRDILYYRNWSDYKRLRRLCQRQNRFAVIGGGFIGSEIAAALARSGKQATIFCAGTGIGSHIFPQELVEFLNDYYRCRDVDVVAGERVIGLEKEGDFKILVTDHGREIVADAVIAGIGIEPNVELAASAGIEIEDGIRVDASLRTTQPGIFAAGDVASFYNPILEEWIRVEHEDNATVMGRSAGRSMAGEQISYDYVP